MNVCYGAQNKKEHLKHLLVKFNIWIYQIDKHLRIYKM